MSANLATIQFGKPGNPNQPHGLIPSHFNAFAIAIATAKLKGREHDKRRPSTSFHLSNPGEMFAAVNVPCMSSPQGWKLSTIVEIKAVTSSYKLRLKVTGDTWKAAAWYRDREKTVRDFTAVIDRLNRLLPDLEGAVRQSNRCIICGRQLTDNESRAKMIGPECIRMFSNIGEIIRASLQGEGQPQ